MKRLALGLDCQVMPAWIAGIAGQFGHISKHGMGVAAISLQAMDGYLLGDFKMKCDKCGTLMHWEGSLRAGAMECSRCKAYDDQALVYGLIADKDVEILSAQPVDPAGCHDDYLLNFYATPFDHKTDNTQCKQCGHVWTSERNDTFAICPSCHTAGWKEYV